MMAEASDYHWTIMGPSSVLYSPEDLEQITLAIEAFRNALPHHTRARVLGVNYSPDGRVLLAKEWTSEQ